MSASARRWLHASLGGWFEANRRELPWRRDRDAYRVWISEAMLQQTRVEAVVPYYERFLARFPDVGALAGASEDEVLAAWSGLGYYRRARSLRAAAQVLVADHGGVFPRELGAALALPGIGPYTAGAVLSIAYGLAVPLVDGNVARVFARFFGLEDEVGSGALKRELDALADDLVPGPATALDPGDWNQAVMELGATVCTPRATRCDVCPLNERCVARRDDRVAALPKAAPKRAPVDVELEIFVVRSGDDVLLVQRPTGGRMARLWEFPTRETGRSRPGGAPLYPEALFRDDAPTEIESERELGVLRHGITHHRIRARVLAASLARGGAERLPVDWRFVAVDELAGLGLTGMARKVVAELLDVS